MLLLKKKKYAAVLVKDQPDGSFVLETETKGLDLVRRDWCQLSKDIGLRCLNQVRSFMFFYSFGRYFYLYMTLTIYFNVTFGYCFFGTRADSQWEGDGGGAFFFFFLSFIAWVVVVVVVCLFVLFFFFTIYSFRLLFIFWTIRMIDVQCFTALFFSFP
jgi:hypothetical protein